VNLVEVDVVRPSRFRLASISWRIALRERPRRSDRGASPPDFRGEDDLFTASELAKRATGDLLARPKLYTLAVSKK